MILPVKVKDIDPLELKDFVPDVLKSALDPTSDDFDPDAKALIDFLEKEILLHFDTINSLVPLLLAEQVPPEFIADLGFELAVRFTPGDSEVQKRKRIQNAIPTHRDSGLFEEDVKPRIDVITGLSSDIFKNPPSELDEWTWLGDTGDDTTAEDWGVWGGGITDGNDSGMTWIGEGLEQGVAGNILIDLGGDAVTPDAAIIQKVVDELSADGQFAYLIIHLGFVTGGIFTDYPNGVIL